MPFEARNTKFTVTSSNHESYNLIKILLRHLLEGSCEITARMRASVRYVGRASTAGLL